MSEIKKLESEVEAKIHDAFNRLRADAQKIIDDLTFRIKQGLHPTNHDPVDGQSATASDALAQAVEAARSSIVNSPVKNAEASDGAAGSATAVGASTTDNSGLVGSGNASGASALEPSHQDGPKPPQDGEQSDPNAQQQSGESKPEQDA